MEQILENPTLSRSLRQARAEIRQLPPERVALAALDIGKNVHVGYLATLAGPIMRPIKLPTLKVGFEYFTKELDQLVASGEYDLIILGHEPTGIYHESWGANLIVRYAAHMIGEASPPIRYRQVNPVLVKRERERLSSHYRKDDFIDTYAITNLLAQGVGSNVSVLDHAVFNLRLCLRQMTRLSKQQARVQIDILRTMERLWPGALGNKKKFKAAHPDMPPLKHLVDSKPMQRIRLRHLLEHCPNPYDLLELGCEGIIKLFRQHGERCGKVTAQRILDVAQQSLLPPVGLANALAAEVHQTWKLYLTYEEQIKSYEQEAIRFVPDTPAAAITSIPGINELLAARYLAPLGDYTRFKKASEIWSFAGFDPLLKQSGNHRKIGQTSKRGSPYLRDTLFVIGHLLISHCPDCTRVYYKAEQRGMSSVGAIIHVANKANRIMFSLLRSQGVYKSPLSEAESQKWKQYAKKRRARKKK